MQKSKHADSAALVVITLTVGLFIAALAVKGITHDLFLEGGVFLVSAKLILLAKNNAETESRMEHQLGEIKALVQRSVNDSGERPLHEGKFSTASLSIGNMGIKTPESLARERSAIETGLS